MDVYENFAKIIEKKTKELKSKAEKFDSSIKMELHKIIDLERKIGILDKNLDLTEEERLKEIEDIKNIIRDTKKKLVDLRREKNLALGCELNIRFADDSELQNCDFNN